MITVLKASDASEMAVLHATSFDPSWPVSDMAAHVAHDICFGYRDEKSLKGFVIIRAAFEQGDVLTIVTDKSTRGQGIGAKLLTAAEESAKARGVEVLFLEVAEDNHAALALYQKSGYEPIGKRPAYYKRAGGRVAALTYRKRLDATQKSG